MQDEIIKFLAYNGKISVVCINSTEMVEKARKIHDLSPVTTAAFGRMLTMTAIMANEMKNAKDKITIQITHRYRCRNHHRYFVGSQGCAVVVHDDVSYAGRGRHAERCNHVLGV